MVHPCIVKCSYCKSVHFVHRKMQQLLIKINSVFFNPPKIHMNKLYIISIIKMNICTEWTFHNTGMKHYKISQIRLFNKKK